MERIEEGSFDLCVSQSNIVIEEESRLTRIGKCSFTGIAIGTL
jgi:hypothetical protein